MSSAQSLYGPCLQSVADLLTSYMLFFWECATPPHVQVRRTLGWEGLGTRLVNTHFCVGIRDQWFQVQVQTCVPKFPESTHMPFSLQDRRMDKPHPPKHLYPLYTWSQSWLQVSVWYLLGTRLNKNRNQEVWDQRRIYAILSTVTNSKCGSHFLPAAGAIR